MMPWKGKAGPGPLEDRGSVPAPVLDEARRAGRPVILTADHGHVLDRTRGRTAGRASRTRRTRPGPTPPATGRRAGHRRDRRARPARLVPRGRATEASTAKKSSPRSTRTSITPPGTPATTAAPPWPRSSSRSSSCCRPTACFRRLVAYDAAGHAPAWWDATAPRNPPAPGPAPDSARPPRPRRKTAPAAGEGTRFSRSRCRTSRGATGR